MIKVVFKNLERSELISVAIQERLHSVFERFPDFEKGQITVTVEMLNSPQQAGPDLYNVKVLCRGGRYKNVMLEKSSWNLYIALADVVDHLLERLNRFSDKTRVTKIKKERNLLRQL